MSSINPLGSIPLPPQPAPASSAGAADGPQFKDFLMDSLREVNDAQQRADRAVEALATGGDVNPAEVLTAVQKADLAFRMMLQVRNKLVQAYDEVKNIRV
jgi:flagellar hook-basal body complex protein FliE